MVTKTTNKPLSLPQVSNHVNSMRTTCSKSELSNIFEDRNGFMDKYFDSIHSARHSKFMTKDLGEYSAYGWTVKVLILEDNFIVLKGQKGKK